jgi:four helix bundle protein
LALDFVAFANELVMRMPKGRATLAGQLEGAAPSIVLNIAEASGEFSRRERARIFRIAARSADECAAALDVGERLRVILPARVAEGKAMLGRIVAMLTALTRRNA